MQEKLKVQIQVICDVSNNIGYISEDTGTKFYKVDRDSISGDTVYDFLTDTYGIDPNYLGTKLTEIGILAEDKLDEQSLMYITASLDDAERLNSFCHKIYKNLNLKDIDFEIQYFDSLHDAEMQNLGNIAFRY